MAENMAGKYSKEQQEWRSMRAEEDRAQKKFYRELISFPSLFTLEAELRDSKRACKILEHQENELKEEWHQYDLERVRCHNLIIFLQYVLGRKQEAFDHCNSLEIDTSKSVIFLTLKAVLQWQFGCKQDCRETMAVLRNLKTLPEYEYLSAVAESEKGHLMICIGPKGLHTAMDLFQHAIDICPDPDTYLWKFDLALAIRRNFSVLAYSAHPQLTASVLAATAEELLRETRRSCPKEAYRARSVLELARLIGHLQYFCQVCDDEQKQVIERICLPHRGKDLFEEAYDMMSPEGDFYILRECGRELMYKGRFERAVRCLERSCQIRETAIAYQQLGKTYLKMYIKNHNFIAPQLSSGRHGASPPGRQPRYGTGLQPDTRYSSSNRHGASPPGRQPRHGAGSQSDTRYSSSYCHGASPPGRQPRHGTGSQPDTRYSRHSANTGAQRYVPPALRSNQGRGRGRGGGSGSGHRAILKNRNVTFYSAADDRVQTAERYFLKGFELDDTNTGNVYDIALLYEGLQRPEEALKYYELIIKTRYDTHSTYLVNAYERSGLLLMDMSENCPDREEQENLKARAEYMFMSSLVECRQTYVHLPQIDANRASLWESYPKLLELLSQSDRNYQQLQKEARIHKLVGEHLSAIQVYKQLMDIHGAQAEGLVGILNNYLGMENIKEAKFILDLILTVEEDRQFILGSEDETAQQLRHLGCTVYRKTGAEAVRRGDLVIARDALRLALLMRGRLVDPALRGIASGENAAAEEHVVEERQEHFDLCIFYDDGGPQPLSDVTSMVKAVCTDIFGMRVSINNEEGMLAHLDFESELKLAESAPLVMFAITPGVDLSPRMTYIADVTIRSHSKSNQVMLVSTEDISRTLPVLLHDLRSFHETEELQVSGRTEDNIHAILSLFHFLLG